MLSTADLKDVIDKLTGDQELSDEDMDQLIENVCITSLLTKRRRNWWCLRRWVLKEIGNIILLIAIKAS